MKIDFKIILLLLVTKVLYSFNTFNSITNAKGGLITNSANYKKEVVFISTNGVVYYKGDKKDITYKDKKTHLEWQVNNNIKKKGHTSNTKLYLDWENSVKYCNDIKFANYNDWRLPSENELKSLIDENMKNKNKLNLTNINLWSSYLENGRYSKILSIYNSNTKPKFWKREKTDSMISVRCVRGNSLITKNKNNIKNDNFIFEENKNGSENKIKKINFKYPARDIYLWNNKIYLLTEKKVFILDKNGNVQDSFGDFKEANSIAVTNKKIYVVDSYQNKVFIYSLNKKLIKLWGSKGFGKNQFIKAVSISVSDDLVYIADRNGKKIKVFDNNGNFIKEINIGFLIVDICVDDSFIYVANYKGEIKVYDKNSNSLEKVIKNINDKFTFINSISSDNNYGLYVGINTPNCLFHIDSSNKVIEIYGKQCGKKNDFGNITGVSFDNSKIYISNFHKPHLVIITKKHNKNLHLIKPEAVVKTKYQGIFKWKRDASNVKFYNGLFWQDNKINKNQCFSFNRATQYCKNSKYNFFGLNINYRLPTIEELKSLKNHKTKFNFFKINKYYWSNTKSNFGHLAYKISSGYDKPAISGFVSASCQNIRCVSNKNYNIFENKSLDDIVDIFKKEIYNQIKKHKYDTEKPHFIKPKKIFKDEFETTEMFHKRLEEEKKKVNEYNKKLVEEYNKKLTQNNLEKLNNNKLNQQALQAAFYIKYGEPKLDTIEYNADEETFTIVIKSQKNNFTYTKKVKVPLKYARIYKKILLDSTLNIELIANKKTIEVYKVAEFNNPIDFVEKNIYLSLKDIKDYKNFIKAYPNSKYVKYAKIRLNQLLKEQEDEFEMLIKANNISKIQDFINRYPDSLYISDLKKRIKDIEKQQRKKIEEREKAEHMAYYSKKRRGDLVCKDFSLFMTKIEVKGYVDDIEEDSNRILIRIVETYGAKPYYKGIKLERETEIWDAYYNWRLCNR